MNSFENFIYNGSRREYAYRAEQTMPLGHAFDSRSLSAEKHGLFEYKYNIM